MPSQLIRRSQFITTYGPGAIIEGPEGPRVIRSLDSSGIFSQHPPARFEITDRRLSTSLLGNARIVRIPSNAELGVPESERVYETTAFPAWSLCVTHDVLYRKSGPDHRACPRCPPLRDAASAWRQAHREAIRFVRACDAGHLDDVDWTSLMQHTAGCTPSYLTWTGGGGALRNVIITCPDCGSQANLGAAYSRDWRCSGRQPEQGTARPGCPRPARMIQRGAANLRLSELQTALTIPPTTTRLHRLLEMTSIASALAIIHPPNKTTLLQAVTGLVSRNLVNASVLNELNSYDDLTIDAAIQDTLASGTAVTPGALRLQELVALRNAAWLGAPPQPAVTPGAPHQFEVVLQEVRRIPLISGRTLRVVPINRLRVVMVQTGYKRMSPTGTALDVAYYDGTQRWFPGVELFGEGIYIDLAPSGPPSQPPRHFPLTGQAASAWLHEWTGSVNLDPLERERIHPVYVWWHTLAHRLINALAIDSGYSSAAIRERVLVDIDSTSGAAGGGLLLYTVQPGGDGTLGGLVALVPDFERVLSGAFRDIDACSNDPLCKEERFAPGRYNGAACYSCGLVSETSCEVRNLHLDRNLLLENLP